MMSAETHAEEQEGNEIEERRPDHRVLWAQHPRRHHRCDRVGGIVQAIEEIERERDGDQRDQDRPSDAGAHVSPPSPRR